MTAPLPSGLTPVAAGRLGLWLLGKRNHTAAQRRVAFPARANYGTTFPLRLARLITPWKIYEYPGIERFLSGLLGIAPSYAHNLLKPGARLTVKHARKMADFLGNHASQCEALAHELRDYATAQERSKIYDKRIDRRKKHP